MMKLSHFHPLLILIALRMPLYATEHSVSSTKDDLCKISPVIGLRHFSSAHPRDLQFLIKKRVHFSALQVSYTDFNKTTCYFFKRFLKGNLIGSLRHLSFSPYCHFQELSSFSQQNVIPPNSSYYLRELHHLDFPHLRLKHLTHFHPNDLIKFSTKTLRHLTDLALTFKISPTTWKAPFRNYITHPRLSSLSVTFAYIRNKPGNNAYLAGRLLSIMEWAVQCPSLKKLFLIFNEDFHDASGKRKFNPYDSIETTLLQAPFPKNLVTLGVSVSFSTETKTFSAKFWDFLKSLTHHYPDLTFYLNVPLEAYNNYKIFPNSLLYNDYKTSLLKAFEQSSLGQMLQLPLTTLHVPQDLKRDPYFQDPNSVVPSAQNLRETMRDSLFTSLQQVSLISPEQKDDFFSSFSEAFLCNPMPCLKRLDIYLRTSFLSESFSLPEKVFFYLSNNPYPFLEELTIKGPQRLLEALLTKQNLKKITIVYCDKPSPTLSKKVIASLCSFCATTLTQLSLNNFTYSRELSEFLTFPMKIHSFHCMDLHYPFDTEKDPDFFPKAIQQTPWPLREFNLAFHCTEKPQGKQIQEIELFLSQIFATKPLASKTLARFKIHWGSFSSVFSKDFIQKIHKKIHLLNLPYEVNFLFNRFTPQTIVFPETLSVIPFLESSS